MVFSSISFLCFFLPALLAVYYITPVRFRRGRNLILLAGSLIFYAWGGSKYLLLLLLSVTVNYICGFLAAEGTGRTEAFRKGAVGFAAAAGIGLLFVFKYTGFFARTLNRMGADVPVPEIALPIGISFFTFQGLSYVIDVYRGHARVQRDPMNVALYILLFPQLVAGPIVRYATVSESILNRRETVPLFSEGAVRFCVGLAKKMVLANSMGQLADAVYAKPPESLPALLAWLGAIAYTFQIYFDFSAYSDMAIGLGKMFGFRFEENFNYPYISTSITEFWRRWHISLSTWFRDYVYIPLGGNRCSEPKHIRNLTVVWLLTGLWHGANWTFLIWGVWHLLLLLGEKYLWGGFFRRMPGPAQYLLTMLAVTLGWVLFRSDTIVQAFGIAAAMFGGGDGVLSGETIYYLKLYLPALLLCGAASWPVRTAAERFLEGRKAFRALNWLPKLYALAMLALSYLLLATGSFNPFIYFQF